MSRVLDSLTLAITAFVVLCLAVPATSVAAAPPVQAAPAARAGASAPMTPSAAALKQDMRKLWTDHVVWTRDYIIAAVGNQPDAQAAANRLMRNQEDIGNAVGRSMVRLRVNSSPPYSRTTSRLRSI